MRTFSRPGRLLTFVATVTVAAGCHPARSPEPREPTTEPVRRITTEVIESIDIPPTGGIDLAGVASTDAALWAIAAKDDGGGGLFRVDPASHEVSSFHVGEFPQAIFVGAGAVWVLAGPGDRKEGTPDAGTLTRVDPTTGELGAVPIDAQITSAVATEAGLWTVRQDRSVVTRLSAPGFEAVEDQPFTAGASAVLTSFGSETWLVETTFSTTSTDATSAIVLLADDGARPARRLVIGGASVHLLRADDRVIVIDGGSTYSVVDPNLVTRVAGPSRLVSHGLEPLDDGRVGVAVAEVRQHRFAVLLRLADGKLVAGPTDIDGSGTQIGPNAAAGRDGIWAIDGSRLSRVAFRVQGAGRTP